MAGPAGRRDAVLVCGGRWHDFDHARVELLTELAAHEQVRTRVFEDYSATGALLTADLLITYTCDVRPTLQQQELLQRFVARGGRWLALHGTNAAIDPPVPGGPRIFTTPDAFGELTKVLGSRFRGHPPITPYQVDIDRPRHPLVQDIDPFEVSDELYVSEIVGPLDVLASTYFDGACPGFADADDTGDGRQPVLYLREEGAGSVCYFTLGHCRGRFDVQDLGVDDTGVRDLGSWTSPAFRTLLTRCVRWAVEGPWWDGPEPSSTREGSLRDF
jgi:uncharacterized protein